MRSSLVLSSIVTAAALAASLAGCSSSGEKKPSSPTPVVNEPSEAQQAGDALAEKLRGLTLAEEKPTIAVGRVENRTTRSMDTSVVEDEAKKRVLESGKFSLVADGPAAYALTGKVSNTLMKSGDRTVESRYYHFDITRRSDRAVLMSVTKEFKLETTK